jgi:hypothetical protein
LFLPVVAAKPLLDDKNKDSPYYFKDEKSISVL